jgi:hypothetical protein
LIEATEGLKDGSLLVVRGKLAMLSLLRYPQYWRERAKTARAQAEAIDDPIAKDVMLQVAANYEKLATRAEARELGIKPP